MNKLKGLLLVLVVVSAGSFAQQVDSTKKPVIQSQTSAVITDNTTLKKQVNITPNPKRLTNWSKIKDLFL